MTTYLIYAVGEIFLVVVGILIAVQIDDWNEARKLKARESDYYVKLLEDVKQDKQQVKRLIAETEERLAHSNQLLFLLQQNNLNPKSISHEMLMSISMVTYTFKPSTAAFDDLKSSGNLGLIDEGIASGLREYYTNIEGIVDVVDINSDQAVRLFYDTDNYARIGWQLIDFVDVAIDDSVVDKLTLQEMVTTDQAYRDELVSDAVYFIGSGARVLMLYQGLEQDSDKMIDLLVEKCRKVNVNI